MQNVQFFIDGQPTDEVYGFAQYPTVTCHEIVKNADGSDTYDKDAYGSSKNYHPFSTLETCLEHKSNELPPILFFYKPTQNFSEGKHFFKVVTSEETKEISFTISTAEKFVKDRSSAQYTYNFHTHYPYFIDSRMTYQQIMNIVQVSDTCADGYYYESSYMRVPLVKGYYSEMFRLSFADGLFESSLRSRLAYIKFNDQIYDLLLPASEKFYFSNEYSDSSIQKYIPWQRSLYIPRNIISLKDGTLVSSLSNKEEDRLSKYQLMSIDELGKIYTETVIPWETSGSSGCDG